MRGRRQTLIATTLWGAMTGVMAAMLVLAFRWVIEDGGWCSSSR
jgi:hypothetical protein